VVRRNPREVGQLRVRRSREVPPDEAWCARDRPLDLWPNGLSWGIED